MLVEDILDIIGAGSEHSREAHVRYIALEIPSLLYFRNVTSEF
jgi:hypothetical protein